MGGWLMPSLEAYGHVHLSPGFSLEESAQFIEYCKDQYVDAVINAAGWNNRRCHLQQLDMDVSANHVNGVWPKELAAACWKIDLPFYHISTEYVFGKANGQGPFNEDVRPLPDTRYGRSKYMGDVGVLSCGGYVIRASVLPDHFPYKVAATNIISSKLRASEGARRIMEFVTNGIPGKTKPALIHICGERRSIAEFVKHELQRTDVEFKPLHDDVERPLDSSLCSIYPQDKL
jgi:dTDP-4-dehydrorhamnose reductase